MWFLFGFVTLVSFTSYFAYKRIRAAWVGIPKYAKRVGPYTYKLVRNKNRSTRLLIGLDAPRGYDFALKSEAGLDRFFKALGISEEFQSGVAEFDRAVYIVSDDKRFHKLLASDDALRQAVLNLIHDGPIVYSLKEIRCNSGRLWVEYKPRDDLLDSGVDAIGAEVVPLLKRIAQALTASPYASPGAWQDPFVFKAAFILAVSSGLAVNGVVHLIRISWLHVPVTLTTWPLFTDALRWGGAITVVLVGAALLLLGRSARTHLVLIELLLVGTFGAVSTAGTELRDVNMEWDKSEPAVHELMTVSKRIRHRRKSPDKYLITVPDWANGGRGSVQLEVSPGLYRSVKPGEKIRLYEKPGYLNYRWIERIEKAESW